MNVRRKTRIKIRLGNLGRVTSENKKNNNNKIKNIQFRKVDKS